jgi:hypothetical protein
MSFKDGSSGQIGMATKECKRDYEREAATIKKSLDNYNKLYNTLLIFIREENTYDFKDISSMAELVGGLMINRVSIMKNYEYVLAQIEKE